MISDSEIPRLDVNVTLYPSVAIILVNWNGWRDSIAAIESCLALDHLSFRIIVCDNDSSDGSVDHILAWARGEKEIDRDLASPVSIAAPRLPRGVTVLDRAAAEHGEDGGGAELLIVPTGNNLGFAGGNNVGLRWALSQSCEFAWLLNNDTVVPREALSQLVATCAAAPDVGICGSTMIQYHQPDMLQGYAGAMSMQTFRGRHLGAGIALVDLPRVAERDPLRAGEVMYPIGASILVTRAFLKTIGLMEERYFLYYEEVDWVLRGRPRFSTAIARDSLVYHKVGASAGSTPTGVSARSVGFLYRSRLRAARKFVPSAYLRVVVSIVDEALRGLMRGHTGRAVAATRALTGRVRVPMVSRGE